MIGALLAALLLTSAQDPAAAREVVAEVRVHGNHATPDAEIVALSGARVGEPVTAERLGEIEAALAGSGRFEHVEVRKRYLSIADATAVVLVIVVSEPAGAGEEEPFVPGPLRRIMQSGMWMPMLDYEDGYGFTYGARVSFVDALGASSRVSIPLTWGGTRRAVVEADRRLERGPLTRILARGGVMRRENPHYEIGDMRQLVEVRGERTIAPWLRASAGAAFERVSFGERNESQWSADADLTLDTRLDPAFPRNAVYGRVRAGRFHTLGQGVARWSTAFDGYVGLPFATVLALRTQASGAGGPLPPWEQALLGGLTTVRGYRPGSRAGDHLAAASLELRVPLTSPLSVGRFGVRGFVDAGTTWNDGERIGKTRWDRGVGGGVFFNATVFNVSADVAWPESGGSRWHFGLGFKVPR